MKHFAEKTASERWRKHGGSIKGPLHPTSAGVSSAVVLWAVTRTMTFFRVISYKQYLQHLTTTNEAPSKDGPVLERKDPLSHDSQGPLLGFPQIGGTSRHPKP